MAYQDSARRRAPAPLDQAGLERLALRYVERFATTRAKLIAYLNRKLRERGWAEDHPAAPAMIADRFVALGYIDDGAYGAARARTLARKGLGARRVAQALHAAGVAPDLAGEILEETRDEDSALRAAFTFARRRRFGPFATATIGPAERERQLAAFLRAGHSATIARKVLKTLPEEVSNFIDG